MKSLVIYGLLFIGILGHTQAQKFIASLNKRQVAVGETFQVTFRLEDAQTREIEYPDFKNFQLLGGPNTSQSMQIINGQMSQSVSYSFYLSASNVGKFQIGSAKATVKGKTYSTDPITVTVVKGNPQPNAAQGSGGNQGNISKDVMAQIKENVFLRATVSKANVYKGEPLTLTYKLYTRVNNMSNPYLTEAPTYKGFWVEELEVNDPPKTEVYEGLQYRTNIIKRAILFPQQSGKLTVEPLKLESNVRVTVRNPRRRRSIFDDVFGQYQDVPYAFGSNPVVINVKPLPTAGKPADFSGAIGSYALDVTLDKTSTTTGDPITMKIKVSGKGNIKMISLPEPNFPPDFDVYDPNITDQVARSAAGLSGSKSFDYPIVPRNPGEYKLPIVSFSFFDPAKGTYVNQTSEEFLVTVTGEPQQTMAVIGGNINKEDLELIGEDIRFIKNENSGFKTKGSSFLRSAGFWILYILPFALFGGLIAFKNRQEKLAGDVAGTRSRKAQKLAQKRLSLAKTHIDQNDDKGFYDEIARAMWGYISDKLNIGQSELSRENVREKLLSRGVALSIIDRFTQLLDTCEMALFAPSAVAGGMDSTYQEAMQLIVDIENPLKEFAVTV